MNYLTKPSRIIALILFAFTTNGALSEISFQELVLKSDNLLNGDAHFIDHDDLTASILLSGNNFKDKWLHIASNWDKTQTKKATITPVSLPDQLLFFDSGRLSSSPKNTVFFLTTQGISYLNPSTLQPESLITSQSIFRSDSISQFKRLALAYDVNEDGLSDFIVPDFNRQHLFIQQDNLQFTQFDLQQASKMEVVFDIPRYQIRTPYLYDINGDHLLDILFQENGQLNVFTQSKSGKFNNHATTIDLNAGIQPELETLFENRDGRDLSDSSLIRFNNLLKINNDNLPDLIVEKQTSKGMFNRSSSYSVHYGKMNGKGLFFNAIEDTAIQTKGIQFDLKFEDLNGDGLKDFYAPSKTFGIGTIVKTLLTGSIGIDVIFHILDSDDGYSNHPQQTQKAKIKFDFNSGRSSYPAINIADYDGDSLKDLLIQTNDNQFKIYLQHKNSLYSSQQESFTMDIPHNGALLSSKDLNADGKADIIVHYGNDDPVEKRNKLIVWLSN